MDAVMVEITTRPSETRPEESATVPDLEVVLSLDELVESTGCSCSADDDQPY
ncbi:hypothetical protein [Embleya sp. NPDC005575]|uniref:hypothetical protein n=1 Tax=Embleya sp. NPDC005575 TaxID=3156892 RepID=UPI0033BBAF35